MTTLTQIIYSNGRLSVHYAVRCVISTHKTTSAKHLTHTMLHVGYCSINCLCLRAHSHSPLSGLKGRGERADRVERVVVEKDAVDMLTTLGERRTIVRFQLPTLSHQLEPTKRRRWLLEITDCQCLANYLVQNQCVSVSVSVSVTNLFSARKLRHKNAIGGATWEWGATCPCDGGSSMSSSETWNTEVCCIYAVGWSREA